MVQEEIPAIHITSTVRVTMLKLRPSIPTKYSACKIPHSPKFSENQVTFSVNKIAEKESPLVFAITNTNNIIWIAEIAIVKILNTPLDVAGMNKPINAGATGVKIKVVSRYCDMVYINRKNRKIINPNMAQKI